MARRGRGNHDVGIAEDEEEEDEFPEEGIHARISPHIAWTERDSNPGAL